MGRFSLMAAILAATALVPIGASAQELPGELSANVALTTNYVFRGISQTDDGPAIQGGFDYGQGLFYAGAWGSSVDFGDDTTMELDLYAGLTPTYNMLSFDFGVIYYAYPDSPELATGSQDFVEVYGGVSAPVGPFEVGGSVAYSPDFYGEIGDAFYYAASLGLDLSEITGIDGLGIDGGYGFSRFDDNMLGDNYEDYNAGISFSLFGLDLDARYFGTSGLAGNDDSLALTVSKSF